jgi:hypothetical protein
MNKAKEKPSRTRRITTTLASVIAGIGVLAALIGNIKVITETIEGAGELIGHVITGGTWSFPHKEVKVCMGEGGGENCAAGATAFYDCDAYHGMGGGNQRTYDYLANNFCGYTNFFGTHKVYPHNISVYRNNGGGKCGWVGFTVICN